MSRLENARQALFSAFGKSEMPKPELKSDKDQSPQEIKLANFVKSKIEEVRLGAPRVSHEGIWLTNIAYALGFDSIYYDTNMRQFRPREFPGQFMRQNRIHVNKILPTLQNRLARICKSPPRYDVRPNSGDDEDKDSARLGMQVLKQLWEKNKINKKRLDMHMWTQQCGHAYFKVSWDTMKGRRFEYRNQATGKTEIVYEGDIRIDVCSAFEVFPDPLAKNFDDVRWLVHAKLKPLEYFRDHYQRGYLVKAEDAWLTSVQYEQRINSFNSQTGGTGTTNQLKNAAIELMYYEKPSKKHPNGRHVITANGVLLKDGDLPIDELPFGKFDDILVAGKYSSESVVTHLRSLQDQYNRTLTQRANWTNRMLTGKFLSSRGHNLMNEALNDQSGEVVEYDPVPGAPPPTAMNTPQIPSYAYKEEESLDMNLGEVAGLGEVSKGQLPSASIPAIGMQFLVEQDDTRIGVMTEQHEHSYADLGRIMLKFVGAFYIMPRVLKIAGNNMEYTTREFVGDDLRENFDVTVIRGSTLPGSKVLRRQELLNLYQMGLMGNPTDPTTIEKLLGMLEHGDIAEAWKDHALDMAQIKKAISEIEQEIMPSYSEFNNHGLWMQELNRYRKSDKYDRLSETSQGYLIELINTALNEIMEMSHPEAMEDEEQAPDMQLKDEAQAEEERIINEGLSQGLINENLEPQEAPPGEVEPETGGII